MKNNKYSGQLATYDGYSNIGLIKVLGIKADIKPNTGYLLRGNILPITDKDLFLLSRGYVGFFYALSCKEIQGKEISKINQIKHKLLRDSRFIPNIGLIISLLFNDRDLISEDLISLYKNTSIFHLLAISGLHIMIFYSLGRRSSNNLIIRKIVGLISALTLCIHTNYPITAIRAYIMLLLWELLDLFNININSSRKLGLCCLIIPTLFPFCFLGSALWLSVLIVYFFINNKATDPIFLQISLFIYLLPINMLFFGYVFINSVVCNLLAIPFYMAFMPLLYAAYIYWLFFGNIIFLIKLGESLNQLHNILELIVSYIPFKLTINNYYIVIVILLFRSNNKITKILSLFALLTLLRTPRFINNSQLIFIHDRTPLLFILDTKFNTNSIPSVIYRYNNIILFINCNAINKGSIKVHLEKNNIKTTTLELYK